MTEWWPDPTKNWLSCWCIKHRQRYTWFLGTAPCYGCQKCDDEWWQRQVAASEASRPNPTE